MMSSLSEVRCRKCRSNSDSGAGIDATWLKTALSAAIVLYSWCTSTSSSSSRSSSMSLYSLVTCMFVCSVAVLQTGTIVEAGHCWNMINKKGRCVGPLAVRISKEDCCLGGDASTAWTPEDLDSGRFFFWMALGGGVPNCQPCKDSCKDVRCPEGRKCVLRKGQPKCVCSLDCSKQRRMQGPVCGTDGRTYRHYCQLRKRSCRKKKHVQLAYFGACQKSCRFLTCPGKKQCLLDQNHNPHCVRCSGSCPEGLRNFVCGVDGVTYNSLCHLQQAACQLGSAIPLAYFGKCKVAAKCDNVRCGKRRTCLMDMETGRPRCGTCQYNNCKSLRLRFDGAVCGTNNHTYTNWCYMMQESCNTGVVIETKHSGACEENISISSQDKQLQTQQQQHQQHQQQQDANCANALNSDINKSTWNMSKS